jgi:hypothetical protein
MCGAISGQNIHFVGRRPGVVAFRWTAFSRTVVPEYGDGGRMTCLECS